MAQVTEDRADSIAGALYTALTDDLPAIPAVDLSSPDFTFEEDNDSALYNDIPEVSIDQLTAVQLEGPGVFDKMMAAADLHIQREFKGNRIVGADYAKVYTAIITTMMGNAVQFALGSQTAHWQAVTAQMQARQAEIEVTTARVNLETAKVNAMTATYQMEQVKAQVGLTKMEIANANMQHLLLTAQQYEQNYKNENLLPLTKAQQEYTNETLLVDQHMLTTGQINEQNFKVNQLLPITRDQEQYNLDTILVDQHLLLTAQHYEQNYKNVNLLPLTKAQQEYTNETLLVDQHTLTTGQINELTFKVSQLLPITRDQQQYNLDTILVDQHTLIQEQIEAERAKTLNTRQNGTVVAGLIGKQKEVQDQQIASFVAADQYKIAKMYFDGHISQISILDVLPSAPAELASTEISDVMAAARAGVGL